MTNRRTGASAPGLGGPARWLGGALLLGVAGCASEPPLPAYYYSSPQPRAAAPYTAPATPVPFQPPYPSSYAPAVQPSPFEPDRIAPAPPPVAVAPIAPPGIDPRSIDPAVPPPIAGTAPTPNPDDAARFDALRTTLERQNKPAAPASPVVPAAAPAPGGAPADCTTVRTRAGFRDHYGGLNTAGDVPQRCVNAAP